MIHALLKKPIKALLILSILSISIISISNVGAAKKSRFEKLELFSKVLYLVENSYYRKVDVEKLIQGALQGMLSTLDPHSAFLNEEVFQRMQEDTSGEFGGLGIEVTQKEGILVVITPIEDTPAFKAGLKPGDKIVEINHESTLGLTLEEAVDKMRGKPNTKITVGVSREGEKGVKSFVLKREIIKVQPVKSEILNKEFIYLKLTQFQENSAKIMIKAIKKHKKLMAKKKRNLKGIVLDLRFNPGGLLNEAVNVSSIFMKEGIVVSTEGRDPKLKDIKLVRKDIYKETKVPMVVLINGSSASASEIVAGALQDSKRAVIMGTQSFGKGSVQTIHKIDDTQGVKLTIAQYMTPKNRKIQAVGIKPDIMLDQIDSVVFEENKEADTFIRERDLKNHLTATIETKEEKKLRLVRERKERAERIKKIKERQKNKDSSDKTAKKKSLRKTKPGDDFQVIQAVNYLKGYTVFDRILKK